LTKNFFIYCLTNQIFFIKTILILLQVSNAINNPCCKSDLPVFFYLALFLKKFRGKQAIPSLIDLSPLIKIHPRFLQQSQVQPSKIFLVNFPLDFN